MRDNQPPNRSFHIFSTDKHAAGPRQTVDSIVVSSILGRSNELFPERSNTKREVELRHIITHTTITRIWKNWRDWSILTNVS